MIHKVLNIAYSASLVMLIHAQKVAEFISFDFQPYALKAFIWGLIGNGCWSLMSIIWDSENDEASEALTRKDYLFLFIKPIAAAYAAVLISEGVAYKYEDVADGTLKMVSMISGFTFAIWAKKSVIQALIQNAYDFGLNWLKGLARNWGADNKDKDAN